MSANTSDIVPVTCDDKQMVSTCNVLIICTGSVASIKIPLLVKSLQNDPRISVRVVATKCALHFFSVSEVPTSVLTDENEWGLWQQRGDPILHIELRDWAHLLLIAPLDANTMAKISHGLCDNLATCVARAWNMLKPVLYCPAMNTQMWQHPVTLPQIEQLQQWGFIQINPIEKTLMCGEKGLGAMAEVDTIVNKVRDVLKL